MVTGRPGPRGFRDKRGECLPPGILRSKPPTPCAERPGNPGPDAENSFPISRASGGIGRPGRSAPPFHWGSQDFSSQAPHPRGWRDERRCGGVPRASGLGPPSPTPLILRSDAASHRVSKDEGFQQDEPSGPAPPSSFETQTQAGSAPQDEGVEDEGVEDGWQCRCTPLRHPGRSAAESRDLHAEGVSLDPGSGPGMTEKGRMREVRMREIASGTSADASPRRAIALSTRTRGNLPSCFGARPMTVAGTKGVSRDATGSRLLMARVRNLILCARRSTDTEPISLAAGDPARDCVLMAELHDEATYVRHHKKKIAFLSSPPCAILPGNCVHSGWTVDYVNWTLLGNWSQFFRATGGSCCPTLTRAHRRHGSRRMARLCGSWRVAEAFSTPGRDPAR